jgi:hypothetical protein
VDALPSRPREQAVTGIAWKGVAVGLALAAWFLDHTWRGLLCGFQGDDMMNMYQAWILPVWRLAWGNLTPFSAVYRPVGSVFYRVMYAAAGFHPLPFRIVLYAVMLVNIGLLYRFARQVTDSSQIGAEAAALAALIGSYHNHLIDMYQDGGVVYDILCYTFVVAAMSCYIAGRTSGRSAPGAVPQSLRGWALVRFFTLALLALNSKEMALTLAPALWVYELVYYGPSTWRPPGLWQWAQSQKSALWILTIATPFAAWAKTQAGSAFYGVGGYQVHLTWAQWIETTRDWIEGLLYLPYTSLSATGAVLILLLPWAMAAFVRDRERRKPFLLCAALVLILPLPVNFITKREFFVMYLPLAAWSICAACALTGVRGWLVRNLPRTLAPKKYPEGQPPWNKWAPWALAALTVAALHAAQHHDRFRKFEWVDPSQEGIRTFAAGLAEICPSIPPDGKVEVLDDPFDKTGWDPSFITRLWTRRLDIEVHRWPPARSDDAADHYDCTLAYRGGRFVRLE